jgi:hypothetical protein
MLKLMLIHANFQLVECEKPESSTYRIIKLVFKKREFFLTKDIKISFLFKI